ncbi:MAG: hypothetical protein ACE5FL_06475 [Myxococcota bacterium]
MKTSLLLHLLLGACTLAPGFARATEVVDLIPEKRAPWGATDIFAPITGFFLGGPSYWYETREIEIETVPPGAVLDLFYVRASFQKRYEQAESPVIVRLPSRVSAGKRDAVTIRALLDGYQQAEAHVRVRSRQKKVLIELEPLANSLLAVTHRYLAGRGSLGFLTKEALNFRIQKASGGMSVVLTGTGIAPGAGETLDGVSSPFVTTLKPRQLGEDLVIQVGLTEVASSDRVEVRSRQAFDVVRGVHTFSLDIVPLDGGDEGVRRAKAAFAALSGEAVTGCALAYDAALREQLDRAALSRALAPAGSFTDPYLREAMKRLGQLSPDGIVRLTDGSTFQVAAPIELMAAWSQAADAVGYLALLRGFVARLEPQENRRSTLRGLVAPEASPARFAASVDAAEERERSCRAGQARAAVGPL